MYFFTLLNLNCWNYSKVHVCNSLKCICAKTRLKIRDLPFDAQIYDTIVLRKNNFGP